MSFGYERRVPARLKNLRIDSVDSVDKGAGGSRGSRGCEVVLMKRDADDSAVTKLAAIEAAIVKAARSAAVSKVELSAMIAKRAEHLRRSGETREQAYVRFITEEPLGQQLFKILQASPGRDHHAQAAFEKFEHRPGEDTHSEVEDISTHQSPHYKKLVQMSEDIRRSPEGKGMSAAQAFTHCATRTDEGRELLAADKAWHQNRADSLRSQAALGI